MGNTNYNNTKTSKSSEDLKGIENINEDTFVNISKENGSSFSFEKEKNSKPFFQKLSSSKEIQKKFNFSQIEDINIYDAFKRSTIDFNKDSISKNYKIFQIPLNNNLKHNRSHIMLLNTSSNWLNKSKSDRKMSYDFENVSNKPEFEKTFYEDMSKLRHQSHDEGLPNEIETNIGIEENKNNDSSILDNSECSSYQYDFELKLFKRSEDLRKSYISKLIATKIWQPSKKENKHNTMIIFDWDDTLLCTSYLTPTGIFNEEFELSEKDKDRISKLEEYVVKIINLAIAKGDTYIITNAAPGWVEYSAERFYPEVKEILHKVTIVSARGEYEKLYPGDSRQWKIQAFLEMKKNFDSELVANIICMGDSIIEMEAAHVLASKFSQAFIKTIKFREAPKPEELVKQLSLVADQFSTIYSSVKNLTIRVERKSNKK